MGLDNIVNSINCKLNEFYSNLYVLFDDFCSPNFIKSQSDETSMYDLTNYAFYDLISFIKFESNLNFTKIDLNINKNSNFQHLDLNIYSSKIEDLFVDYSNASKIISNIFVNEKKKFTQYLNSDTDIRSLDKIFMNLSKPSESSKDEFMFEFIHSVFLLNKKGACEIFNDAQLEKYAMNKLYFSYFSKHIMDTRLKLSSLKKELKTFYGLINLMSIIQSNSENIYIPYEEVYQSLTDVLDNKINVARASKDIFKKPHKHIEIKSSFVKHEFKKSKYIPANYSQENLNYLKLYGFNASDSKRILKNNKFDLYKTVIDNLSKIMKNAEISKINSFKEIKKLCNVAPGILFGTNNPNRTNYLNLVNSLLNSNPSVSGVLPSYATKHYSSFKRLNDFYLGTVNLDVPIIGLELILPNEPDLNSLFSKFELKRRKQNKINLTGRIQSKLYFVGTTINKDKDNALYSACVKEVGSEKVFRNVKLGFARALLYAEFDKTRDTNVYHIFKYFTTHKTYEKWWG